MGEFVVEGRRGGDPAPLPPNPLLRKLLAHEKRDSIADASAGGTRAVLAENILLKQQLLVLQRSRRRAPNLRTAASPSRSSSQRQLCPSHVAPWQFDHDDGHHRSCYPPTR